MPDLTEALFGSLEGKTLYFTNDDGRQTLFVGVGWVDAGAAEVPGMPRLGYVTQWTVGANGILCL